MVGKLIPPPSSGRFRVRIYYRDTGSPVVVDSGTIVEVGGVYLPALRGLLGEAFAGGAVRIEVASEDWLYEDNEGDEGEDAMGLLQLHRPGALR